MIQRYRPGEAQLPRRAVRRLRPRPPGRQRPALPHPARPGPRDPPAYLDAGADIICDQHLQRHRGSPRPTTACEDICLRAQPRGRRGWPPRGRRGDGRRRPTSRGTSPGRSARPRARLASRPTSTTRAPATCPSTSWSAAYLEEADGLVDGGADILLIETIFDTLNAKAAIFAVETLFEERGRRWPVIVSGTITDASAAAPSPARSPPRSGTRSGTSRPLAVGLNCALGAEEIRPYVAELARIADTFVSTHPNAGLPNAFGEYDETPEHMAAG